MFPGHVVQRVPRYCCRRSSSNVPDMSISADILSCEAEIVESKLSEGTYRKLKIVVSVERSAAVLAFECGHESGSEHILRKTGQFRNMNLLTCSSPTRVASSEFSMIERASSASCSLPSSSWISFLSSSQVEVRFVKMAVSCRTNGVSGQLVMKATICGCESSRFSAEFKKQSVPRLTSWKCAGKSPWNTD